MKAIDKEDYETAQMIKNEMSKIQKNIMSTNDRNNNRTGLSTMNRGRGTTLSPIEFRSKPKAKQPNSKSSMSINDSYGNAQNVGKALGPITMKSLKKIDPLPANDIFAPKRKIGLEERALPALGRETPIDFSKVNEEEFEHQRPDQIKPSKLTLKVDPKYVSYLEKLTNVFGEDLAKKVCADKWYFQQEGIESAVKGLKEGLESRTAEEQSSII